MHRGAFLERNVNFITIDNIILASSPLVGRLAMTLRASKSTDSGMLAPRHFHRYECELYLPNLFHFHHRGTDDGYVVGLLLCFNSLVCRLEWSVYFGTA